MAVTLSEKKAQRRKRMLAWLGYAVLAVLLCLTENTWYAFDGMACINLLPVLVCAVGLFEGICGGAYFGIFCGVLSDAAGGSQLWVMPVLLALLGLAAGAVSGHVYKKSFWFFLLYDLAACIFSALVRMAGGLLAGGGMTAILQPALLWNGLRACVIGMLLYVPVLLLSVIGREVVHKVARNRARIVGRKK
ncbi:MAG: hypothetical protein MJ175_12355 [Clostridia bacterium]|nr:hypothetical protein [Clostridia bacterium]